ncbi:MAG TPA: NAD(P)H-hydrate dehydratase [Pseudomonadota bacterium]|nr:NAD(P)H-hydrate dehydratase [Xanthomonadales bacterium]HQW80593.1 NAD(P)H-hydrate dehydratase [Pseudomonadota bacterium]
MTGIETNLYRVADVRLIEAQAKHLTGQDAWSLMQRAGAAAFAMLRERWPEARRILVVCGTGNNGGDGYVVALLARNHGLTVTLVQGGALPTRDPAAQAVVQWHDAGGAVITSAGEDLPGADLIIDALLGIGLDRAPEGVTAAMIAAINRHPAPVFALDAPSGLNADTGHPPADCVQAERTLSFIAWKRGLWTGAAVQFCGELYLATLSVPAMAFAEVLADAHLMTAADVTTALPRRARDIHKGRTGHALVVGSDHGFGGAVLIAAAAAARAGAGLVSVATRIEHVSALLAQRPEVMARAITCGDDLQRSIERADVIALGPGLGQSDWSLQLAQTACASGKPMVVDADALNLLAAGRIELHGTLVLTPHPGEAARMLGVDVATVERDRFAAVRELAHRHRAVVVLKGAGSLIADRDGTVSLCPFGNPGMASGGMGDALTGVIAALIAQGLATAEAARIGVVVHALAADRAARDGERGLLASDVIAALRAIMNP